MIINEDCKFAKLKHHEIDDAAVYKNDLYFGIAKDNSTTKKKIKKKNHFCW